MINKKKSCFKHSAETEPSLIILIELELGTIYRPGVSPSEYSIELNKLSKEPFDLGLIVQLV